MMIVITMDGGNSKGYRVGMEINFSASYATKDTGSSYSDVDGANWIYAWNAAYIESDAVYWHGCP